MSRIRRFRRATVVAVAIITVTAFGHPTAAQTLEETFDDPTPTNADSFGSSVALDGNNVLIGAENDKMQQGTSVGQAHLFDRTTGSLEQTFNDPTPTNVDEFGASVALDGNNVLIGAPGDDTQGTSVGQAHLFDRTTGSLEQTFNDPTPTNVDEFGFSVALDGNNVLIGARRDSTQGGGVGQANLFDASTGSLEQTFDDPTPTNVDQFGDSVALDGNNVLIGALGDDTQGTNVGQAHLFDRTTGNLNATFDDPTPTNVDQFGSSVALDGNNVLIGAANDNTQGSDVGQVHLFDATAGSLLQTFDDPTPTSEDNFGFSVALDGNNVLIGARLDNTQGTNVGQAHLFDRTTGNLNATFDDPAPTNVDQFGNSVALDGNNMLIGAAGDNTLGDGVGQAHLFSTAEPTAVPIPATLGLFGMGLLMLGRLAHRHRA